MANKRMFTMKICDSDAFLDMPLSTQCLYFHLNMRADDDGFIGNPKKIMRVVGASEDDLKLLIVKRFILAFEDGVLVIKHWRMHNCIQSDRYTPTVYQDEKAMLGIKKNKSYSFDKANCIKDFGMETKCIQNVSTDIDKDIDKDLGIDKDLDTDKGKKKKENTRTIYERLISDYSISEYLSEKISDWITYKMERKESYKEQGMKSLLRQIEKNAIQYGDEAIVNLIDECMAANWKGIIWDKLKNKQEHINKDRIASRVSDVDNW
jgi:hypothetical protein